MKKALLVITNALLLPLAAAAAPQQVVEIDVQGMTCGFCVYGLNKNLSKAPGVANTDVSLDSKKARIVLEPGKQAEVEFYKKIILDSGFTPGEARTYTEGK